MVLGEKLLLLASRTPGGADLPGGVEHWDEATALGLLRQEFPTLDRRLAGASVLDFGCGDGWQSMAMAYAGAGDVLGVDTNPACLARARALAARALLTRVEFCGRIPERRLGTFDLVVSQNSFEHFPDPRAVLAEITAALRGGGQALVSFGPPWLSPYGSHTYFFTKLPWVNLLFSEATVMRVRSRFRNDGAARYEDVEGGLNRMTLSRFERLVHECGLQAEWSRYHGVKGLDWATRIPGARELLTTMVSCVLRKPEKACEVAVPDSGRQRVLARSVTNLGSMSIGTADSRSSTF